MKKLVIVGLVASFTIMAGMFSATTAHAQTTPVEPTRAVRCDITQARLNTRITRVEKVKEDQISRYTLLLSRVESVVTSAESTDYDASELIAARDALNGAIQTFREKSIEYTDSLTATKDLTCGESTDEFKSSLVVSRQALTATRQANLAIHSVFQKEIIPALQAYGAWLKDNSTEKETN